MKKKKKLNIKKIALFIILITLIIIFIKNNTFFNKTSNILNNSLSIKSSNGYDIIKQDNNDKYLGKGQEKVSNKDGYFTTFTTIENNQKTYKEYKQNGDSSWSNNDYWSGTMSDNGCGITAIAIILSGYKKNYTPEDLRQKYYPVLNNDTISQELSTTYGIKNTDFYYDSIHLSKDKLKEHLETNRPILICVWNKPNDNRWTTASHYMVLLATDGDDMVYISNPNGLENSSKSSGWYDFNEVTPYIAKALYIESYN
jgi:hypothetical protein